MEIILDKLYDYFMKKLAKKASPLLAPANLLLLSIFILLLVGLYTSSPRFKTFIDNIGAQENTDAIGTASMTCAHWNISTKVIRTRKYKFFIKTADQYKYSSSIPEDNCKCIGTIDNATKLCQTK